MSSRHMSSCFESGRSERMMWLLVCLLIFFVGVASGKLAGSSSGAPTAELAPAGGLFLLTQAASDDGAMLREPQVRARHFHTRTMI